MLRLFKEQANNSKSQLVMIKYWSYNGKQRQYKQRHSKAMLKPLIILLAITGTISSNSWAHPAKHDHHHAHNPMLLSQKADESEDPKVKAIKKAKTSPEDKVLKISPIDIDGQPMYKIKLLTSDGRVKTVLVEKE